MWNPVPLANGIHTRTDNGIDILCSMGNSFNTKSISTLAQSQPTKVSAASKSIGSPDFAVYDGTISQLEHTL
jgi:hypothetical protein